jgi:fused signal recognition particle receptor
MDPGIAINPADLYELAAIVGGAVGTGLLGLLFVRRARAARRREIEGAGEAQPLEAPPRRRAGDLAPSPEPEPEAEEQEGSPQEEEEAAPLEAAPQEAPAAKAPPPVEKPRAPAPVEKPKAPAPVEKPRAAQVLPFPVPAPKPVPVEAPPPAAAPAPAPAKKKKDGSALAPGLARTRSSGFIAGLTALFGGRKELDPSIVGQLEKVLLTADIGVRTSEKLLEEIRTSLSRKELNDSDAIWAFLKRRSAEILAQDVAPVNFAAQKPFVLLTIGVNGSGKTTTIGKLAAKLTASGLKVMLAAGDTFRAAAAEQLEIWAGRTGASLVRGKEGADPSSVIFDAVRRGVAEGVDVVIADTAGRLHTKTDLMQELEKVRRVISKASPGAPHETWLVIDSTSGQNAIAQAQIFTKAMQVSGIVLTKLDGTAKGGVILGIADQLKLPVRFVGIGERVDDLREFDAEEFVEALFEPAAAPQ